MTWDIKIMRGVVTLILVSYVCILLYGFVAHLTLPPDTSFVLSIVMNFILPLLLVYFTSAPFKPLTWRWETCRILLAGYLAIYAVALIGEFYYVFIILSAMHG